MTQHDYDLLDDKVREFSRTIQPALPFEFGSITVAFAVKNGGVCDINIQTCRKIPTEKKEW